MTEAQERIVSIIARPGFEDQVLQEVLTGFGMRVRAFQSVNECCHSIGEGSCAVSVINLDGDVARGLDLIAEQKKALRKIAEIALVDHGDIPTAVKAIKADASNCFERPMKAEQLATAVDELRDRADPHTGQSNPPLTPTEITVLGHILEGKTSREIAKVLCRSPRTIEVHRSHIMHKLDVSTMVDLVKATFTMGLVEESHEQVR